MIFLLVSTVSAIGVAPAAKLIDFKPGVDQRHTIDIFNNEHKEFSATVYARGDYAEYVEFDQDFVTF